MSGTAHMDDEGPDLKHINVVPAEPGWYALDCRELEDGKLTLAYRGTIVAWRVETYLEPNPEAFGGVFVMSIPQAVGTGSDFAFCYGYLRPDGAVEQRIPEAQYRSIDEAIEAINKPENRAQVRPEDKEEKVVRLSVVKKER